MHFMNTVVLVAAALSLTSALPAPDAASNTFKIQTITAKGQASKYGGLYLQLFHTGAGEFVPVLKSSFMRAADFQFNGTRLITEVEKKPYGLSFGQVEDSYANWGSMTIDTGLGDKGFVVDNSNIVSTLKDVDFGGWRVCQWVHGVPELYFNALGKFSNKVAAPGCELVHLVREFNG